MASVQRVGIKMDDLFLTVFLIGNNADVLVTTITTGVLISPEQNDDDWWWCSSRVGPDRYR